jgi:hypothetical protein
MSKVLMDAASELEPLWLHKSDHASYFEAQQMPVRNGKAAIALVWTSAGVRCTLSMPKCQVALLRIRKNFLEKSPKICVCTNFISNWLMADKS